MKKSIYCILLGIGIAGCGLFTPRTDFEDPITDQVTVDHFNFGALLKGSGEKFSKLDWYELFDDSLKYVNVRLGNDGFVKTELISHLFRQQERYPDAKVTWINNDDISKRGIDTLILNNVTYTIENDTAQFSGNSIFTIIRGVKNFWRIVRWTDEPEADPFFSPAE